MNGFLISIIQSSALAAAFWLLYQLFLRVEKYHNFNRFYLLFGLMLSVLISFIEYRLPTFGSGSERIIIQLPAAYIYAQELGHVLEEKEQILYWPLLIYFAGVFLALGLTLFRVRKLYHVFKKSEKVKLSGYKLAISPEIQSPFSFLGWIFLPLQSTIDDTDIQAVLAHEQAHISKRHSLDLIFSELIRILLWFNPFIWLYRSSIQEVHEYQADQQVLAAGFEEYSYKQKILDVGEQQQWAFLTNNFNHSLLKRRFIMMSKTKSGKWAYLKAGFVVLLIPLIIFSCQQGEKQSEKAGADSEEMIPEVESGVMEIQTEALSSPDPEKDSVYLIADEMPEFPGGLEALRSYLQESINYPEKSRKNGSEGRVFVNFVVNKNGKINDAKILRGVDPLIDQEALRVVEAMPDWTPGYADGKAVKVSFNLPIHFTLSAKEAEKQAD